MDNKWQVGDIGFVMHNNSWVSKAISWFMNSKWSHCFIIIDTSSEDRTYVSETSDYQVAVGWVERYMQDPHVSALEIVRLPNLPYPEQLEIKSRGLDLYEKLYPYWQFIPLAVRGLLKRIKIRLKNFLPFGYNCNENVLYILQNTHYPELKGNDIYAGDTEDFYQLMKKIPGVTTVYSKGV